MLALGGRREPAADRPVYKPLRSGCPGHIASPSPPDQEDVVCCMCGDHGLGRELFRCRSCRVRTQHSYCSELYPRATAYRRCNWCLREPAQGAASHVASVVANGNNKPAAETMRKTTASDEERHNKQRHEGCSSSLKRPPAELAGPVKKKRKADDERAPPGDAGVKAGSCDSNAAAGESNKEMMRAGKPRVRVKVQRYKLLAEVISC